MAFEAGLVVFGFVLFSFIYRRMRESPSGFKENIWDDAPPTRKVLPEDKVDHTIRLEHKPLAQDEASPPKSKIPKAPFFRGTPHEVLGVSKQATETEILAAYKYWIKRYHPDRVTHLGAKYVEQARRRAEQLNAARDFLVKKK